MKGSGARSGCFTSVVFQSDKHPIKSSSPFPGVSTLCFDLTSLMSLCSMHELSDDGSHIGGKIYAKGAGTSTPKGDAYQKAEAPSKELGMEFLALVM
ncbi:UNVERIFIED_CONTAM: hypothetical protein Sradi_4988800 [Sesamum radiatum]|uniref:Uncharacterized protein n=1 Tax=Sesamum radiatum TaxID=300843 RepID=A0AAW2MHR9_SESRA